jgi:outer membrane protein TolC
MMRKAITFILLALISAQTEAGNVLTLDSCRAMALHNNKQLNVSKLKRDVAFNTRKAIRTKYLPKFDVLGGYEYFSKEMSLLSNKQKSSLNNLGTNASTSVNENATQIITNLVQQGLLTPSSAQQMASLLNQLSIPIAENINQIGQQIANSFRTDTRNIWAGSVMVRQPIYMGGAIIAANKIADINEELTANDEKATRQATIYEIDQAYWTVVSLKQKQRLAYSYRDLVKQLDNDVKKMIGQGVATRADGLKVDVRVNEADMMITQVEDGVSLAKMLLCQLCGIPLESNIILADEDKDNLPYGAYDIPKMSNVEGSDNRPEVKMLQNTVDMSKEATKVVRAEYLPHIMLTGGYIISNPNVLNGFQRKFSGMWNVGVTVQMPVWSWMEGTYKVRSSKTITMINNMELSDAREKIELQISQSRFKLNEAQKRLIMATKNLDSANENLRCATIGFHEGVMESTDVMAAQTAWEQAQSQKINAEVEVKLAQVGLEKALGVLQ